MNYWVNLSVIFVIVGFVMFIVALRMVQQRKNTQLFNGDDDRADYKFEVLMEFIKKRMTDITTANLYAENLSEEEFKRRTRRRQELKDALKNCNTGDISSKIYVREYIYELLLNEYGINEEKINWIIPFDNPNEMSAREKFETVLHLAVKKHGNGGLGYLIEAYNLSTPKADKTYRITAEDVDNLYKDIIKGRDLQFEDKLRVVTQIIYSHYKGFGIVDEIRDMAIDGVSGGVSGLPRRMNTYSSYFESDVPLLEKATEVPRDGMNSAWFMYRGKSIHLSFLSFEHEAELRRVVTNVYKYGSPGQLSESRPSIINEMYDGSRITVIRPKLSESWAFFIRKKFDARLLTLPELITHDNSELPIKLIEYLMMGERTCAITGPQGSGKTTLLLAMVKHMHPALNLRVQETSFEANLRTLYEDRNILSFQETDSMSGQDGLDLSKKTDGDVTILGEVATDPVAAWMIQTAQVASRFTLFTHHAKTFSNLVQALRNSLLKVGMFNNEGIAEEQVIKVLEFDIHPDSEINGERYLERITECMAIEYEDESLTMGAIKSAVTSEQKLDALIGVASTYFSQQTQRKRYIEKNIIEFQDGRYVAVNPISEKRQLEIEKRLTPEERVEFREFINKYWGN